MQVPSSLIRDGDPVAEESEVGIVIASALIEDIKRHLEVKQKRLLACLAVGLIAISVGSYLFWTGLVAAGAVTVVLGGLAIGIAVYVIQRAPDVQVKRAEKRFWTLHLFPQQKGVVLYDGTKTIEDVEFKLELITEQDVLNNVREELQDPWNMPVILSRNGNVETTLQDDISQIERVLSNTDRTGIQIPTVSQESSLVNAVNTVSAHTEEGVRDVDTVEVSLEEAHGEVEEIENLEMLAFEDDVEETFSDLKQHSSAMVNRITETQQEMVELLNASIHSVGDDLTMISYNFYCPACLDDEIYTELDLQNDDGELEWYCDTCRTTHGVEQSVPKHRIKDELLEEVWDRLWIEKDDEKRGIYEEIDDQQAELKEREFEQKQEIIRDGANRIKDHRSKIRDLKTEATAGKGAIEEIGDVMVKYDRLREERKTEFQEDIERAVERIDKITEQAIEETRNFEQQKTEAAEKEAEQRAKIQREEEQRRHREMVAAQDGGLGLVGSISSKIHKQKMKMKRRRIETTSGAEDWGDLDVRLGLAVETDRPAPVDGTTAALSGQVTGTTAAEQISVYFEWQSPEEDEEGLLSGDPWNRTDEQTLEAPGTFSAELTGLDENQDYEVRAVAEADDERYTGETLTYPDDAPTKTQVDIEAITEELPETERGDQS